MFSKKRQIMAVREMWIAVHLIVMLGRLTGDYRDAELPVLLREA